MLPAHHISLAVERALIAHLLHFTAGLNSKVISREISDYFLCIIRSAHDTYARAAKREYENTDWRFEKKKKKEEERY